MNQKVQRPFAVFDIDGTLIRWQLYHAVVDRMAKKDMLGKGAHEELHNARMVWKRRENPNAFAEYEKVLIKIYENALPNLNTHEFDQIVDEVANEYKHQTYTYTRELAKYLKNQGYKLLAISGSHQELVRHIGELYGFVDWIGTIYKRIGQKFSGQKKIASLDKISALKELIKRHNLSFKDSWAIGDSGSDVDLLKAVDNPVAFNPDRVLFDEANKHGWNIVIERKNVIYKLEKCDGGYKLVYTKTG